MCCVLDFTFSLCLEQQKARFARSHARAHGSRARPCHAFKGFQASEQQVNEPLAADLRLRRTAPRAFVCHAKEHAPS